MTRPPVRPLVGIAASHHLAEDTYEVQMTGRRSIDAVGHVAECLPMLIPGLPDAVDVGDLIGTLDGIVLTGARANVHPRHYGEALTEAHGMMDEGRDAVTLPLVRAAIERGVPLLGLCKGIQEMNVAFGGSLWPEVGDLPGRHRHRMPKGCKDPKIDLRAARTRAPAPRRRARPHPRRRRDHDQLAARPGGPRARPRASSSRAGRRTRPSRRSRSRARAASPSASSGMPSTTRKAIRSAGRFSAAFGDAARARQARRLAA